MSRLHQHLQKAVSTGKFRPALWRYGIALVLPVIALAVTALIFSPSKSPFFPLFSFAVLVCAVYGGRNSGLTATATSAVLNLLILPPVLSLRVADPEQRLRVLGFAVFAVVLSLLIGLIGDLEYTVAVQREDRVMVSKEYLRVVAEMNHHIRNALEVIQMSAATTGQQSAIKSITESVARIDWALREVLRDSLPDQIIPSNEVKARTKRER